MITVLNYFVLFGIVASAILSVSCKRVLDSVLALATVGSFMSVEFLFLQAPDVAIAEASVGAVLGTVLYIITIRRIATKEAKK